MLIRYFAIYSISEASYGIELSIFSTWIYVFNGATISMYLSMYHFLLFIFETK